MLDTLRSAARSWVAKLLLMLLVVSFAIWGVSASIFSSASNSVMTVGSQRVSPEEFRLAYQRQMSAISRQLGMQLTSQQARAFGVEQQTFSQLSAGAALDELSSKMRLGLSQDRLANLIAEDPAFHGNNGQFDRNVFSARLRNAGLREQDYISERSKVAVRSQVVDAIADGFQAPKVMIDALKKYRDESRDLEFLVLSNANIDPIKAPSEAVLAAWFQTNKSKYRAPELRRFAYVTLQPGDVADPTSVTAEQVRAEYDRRKDNYKTPATRTIEQLAFPSKEMATAALQQMKERQLTFDQLVADQGKTPTDVMLGDFTKDQIPDQAIADAAFGVSASGGTTGIVQGSFGPVMLRVTNIRAETTKSFDEVKDEIRKTLALAAASQAVQSVHDRFEDLRSGGSSLEEAASQLKLKAVTVSADRTGHDGDGKSIDLPPAETLLTDVFRTDVGAESIPSNLGNDGYVWFDVREIIPERDRALSEVRERAVTDWTTEQQREALSAKAADLKAQLDKGGVTLAAIATELGLTVETKTGLRRQSNDAILGGEAAKAAFSGPNGIYATALAADQESRLLMHVTNVQQQPSDALDANDQQIKQIASAAGDDLLDQMVVQLQTDYGVSINQALAEQAMVR